MTAITFTPLYMERIWGGRQLETFYHRTLPTPETPFGEAWEIVDRQDAQSIVETGPLAGKSLNELWQNHRSEIFGDHLPASTRFPLLIKILDCAEDLSIQVHPPAAIAEKLNGEAKTEMWYIADTKPDSKLYVGLKNGTTKDSFKKAIQQGTVAEQVHAITAQPGESIFIQSGRLHAIGAGFLIHEIQQNSDTTYRVFDWNRKAPAGKPRQLHVEQSLACIDFEDFQPGMDTPQGNTLASCPYFTTTLHQLAPGEKIASPSPSHFCIITVVSGKLNNTHPTGQTILLPKGAEPLTATETTSVLRISIE